MKAMKVAQMLLTYPLHYERLQESTMFPAWNMLHSTQHLSHQEIHHKLHPDQYADAYPSVQQTTTLQPALQNDLKMKRTSRWYLWMMNIGLLMKHLKEHCVFMSMVYHMDYAHTHALMQAIRCLCTWAAWDLSDISDYEDYMVTSSNEDIPAFEDTPY